jgi:hypothetical protein
VTPYIARMWPPAAILQAARDWHTRHGRAPAWTDWEAWTPGDPYHPTNKTAARAFGGWLAMIHAAGIAPAPNGAPLYWTEGRIVDALLDYRALHGRWPRQLDWGSATVAHPHYSQAIRRFGTWRKAIAAARGIETPEAIVDAGPVVTAMRGYMGPDGSVDAMAELVGLGRKRLYEILGGSHDRVKRGTAERICTAIDRPDVLASLEVAA